MSFNPSDRFVRKLCQKLGTGTNAFDVLRDHLQAKGHTEVSAALTADGILSRAHDLGWGGTSPRVCCPKAWVTGFGRHDRSCRLRFSFAYGLTSAQRRQREEALKKHADAKFRIENPRLIELYETWIAGVE